MPIMTGHIVFRLMVCCMAALLLAPPAQADQDAPVITWQQVILPPAVIADGYAAAKAIWSKPQTGSLLIFRSSDTKSFSSRSPKRSAK